VSFVELHAFAELLGSPPRAFDRDHYDVPAERFPLAIWLGATLVPTREIVRRLRAAGLRRPRHHNSSADAGPDAGELRRHVVARHVLPPLS
jgi:hypothetical protein